MSSARAVSPAESADLLGLGSGLVGAAGAAPAAALLDRCARAGLPVPAGAVLLDEARRRIGADPDPGELFGPLRAGTSVTLRAAGIAAAPTRTVEGVAADDGPALVDALHRIWSVDATAGRVDVIVVEDVPGIHAGVARTEPGGDDVVDWHEVTPEARAAGGDQDVGRWAARPLGARQRPHRAVDRVPLPPWGMRLVRLLRDVRSVVGTAPWDVHWVDDDERCWLVDLRPRTADVDRDGLDRAPGRTRRGRP